MLEARQRIGEARVFGKLWPSHGFPQTSDLALRTEDDDPPLRSLKDTGRRERPVVRALACRQVVVIHRGGVDRDLLHVKQGLDHRDVDVATAAGPVAAIQGITKAGEGVEAGVVVAQGDAGEGRRPVGIAGHVHQARIGLSDEIERRLVRKRPGLAEP